MSALQPANVSQECLVIFLRPKLGLARSQPWPLGRIVVNEEVYEPASDDWSGFYDWLRDGDERLLGLRWWPFDYVEFVLEHVRHLPYARVGDNQQLEIFFAKPIREPDQHKSGDQDFLYDQVFRSRSGQFALAISTDNLSDTDFSTLRAADADWMALKEDHILNPFSPAPAAGKRRR